MTINPRTRRLMALTAELSGILETRSELLAQLANADHRAAEIEGEIDALMGGPQPVSSDGQTRSIADMVRDYFRAHPGLQATADDLIAAGIPATTDNIRSTMHRLSKPPENFLDRVGRGTYTLAQDGKEVARTA